LVETPLGQLVRQLADATTTRARLAADVRVTGERRLPEEVQVALYRIAQEAMNNVVKHAQASQIEVEVTGRADGMDLVVLDDGRGFDPTSVPPGHMGVGIMCERAEAIGAELKIGPRREGGTRVAVRWREAQAQAQDEQSARDRLLNSPSGASPL